MRVSVAEIARKVDAANLPGTLGALLDHVGEALSLDADETLTAVSIDLKEERTGVWLCATFSTGRGDNPDDYEHTELRWRVALAAAASEDEGVRVDSFADEVPGGPALAKRFVRAFAQLRDGAALRALEVLAIERLED